MKHYKMFLDDLRPCPSDYVCVRSYKEAINMILAEGMPNFISFDHDLGTEESGYDLAKWLVEFDMNKDGKLIDKDFSFVVHSANPVGKVNIESYLNSYLNFKFNK